MYYRSSPSSSGSKRLIDRGVDRLASTCRAAIKVTKRCRPRFVGSRTDFERMEITKPPSGQQGEVTTWSDSLPDEMYDTPEAGPERLAIAGNEGGSRLSEQPSMVEAVPSVHLGDPQERLSADQLACALGKQERAIWQSEQAGELFSVIFERDGPQRMYPAFQAWPAIFGRPLAAVLNELRVQVHGGAAAYGFFAGRKDMLGYVTPVEMLVGSVTTARTIPAWVSEGLRYTATDRLGIVVSAAAAFRADMEA